MWSREHRCAIGTVRMERDGDWIVRTVEAALDDVTQQRAHEDFVNELRRAERSSERAVVLVDLRRAAPLSPAARARDQRFHETHAHLLRDHTAAIGFLTSRAGEASAPSTFTSPPCRWRAFAESADAIAWLEGQARANGMRGLPRGLRAVWSPASPISLVAR